MFHQLLHWHKFYDKSTVARLNALWHKIWWGGKLVGGGAFQLYDGTIQHKVLKIHQIRYNVNIFPYDIVWNVSAIIMIGIGVFLITQARQDQRNLKGKVRHAL